MLKVLLINPVSQKMGLERYFQIPPLSLMQIASLFPENYEIHFWDEVHKPFDFKNSYDLVCITAMTQQAKRAYEIAQFYKNNGTKVILGGMHPSVLPEEAINFCDSVVVGEAEPVFKEVLKDYEEGNLKKIYKAPIPDSNILEIPLPDRKILNSKRYLTKNVIQTTRGCPFRCNFCTVTPFFGNKFRQKPLDMVLKEIDSMEGKLVVFLDDDLFANINYAKNLVLSLKQRGKKWVSQATLKFSEDKDFVKLLRQAGCLGLFIGIESAPFCEQALFKKNERLSSLENSLKFLQDEGNL
ncbi:MAG: radical SAM protein, partial [Thermoanaerobaculia bacterium]